MLAVKEQTGKNNESSTRLVAARWLTGNMHLNIEVWQNITGSASLMTLWRRAYGFLPLSPVLSLDSIVWHQRNES